MAPFAKIVRAAVSGVFLVQLTGCCCCGGEFNEEFANAFQEEVQQELEKAQAEQAEAIEKEIEATIKEQQAQMEQAAQQQAAQQAAEPADNQPAKRPNTAAIEYGDFALKAKELNGSELRLNINRATGKAEGVIAGQYYGKHFKQRLEGTVSKKSGSLALRGKDKKGTDLTVTGELTAGAYAGRIKGTVNGKGLATGYRAKELQSEMP